MVDDVRNLVWLDDHGQPTSYAFTCFRPDGGDCLIGGAPRYFATRPLTQEDIIRAVNQPTFADGERLGSVSLGMPTAASRITPIVGLFIRVVRREFYAG